ncbi:2-C-methyl-D-erythritol 2,4-cyclodiphosphate synthase [Blochmannia endosymbiont of Camponotus sp.]|uniref:2-C-methyl-D-erythritol 2,4-cyclodiphosphate synthase n=1 Tax=Blochmannia endosymbiont of Camponotus sp. TaxID=700220 RepID=UPI0020241F61|nr:2-C-methyl-D-erythritol 2,4-cyclodiphosphate synthase [Blochmannia endosymbiont of Camponotus sp.]URJ30194.1 2-C-methyl-D-erythritol 2,4-cyclodiphosphate synthase [Blochmannia endosymbiont of Camponotus sp.]
MLRIGYGFDVHQFGGCRPLIIGGVTIPYTQKIAAHSDGDVLIHALIDSLLGAACCGDIGSMFPDTDSEYNNIDSRKLLRISWNKIVTQGYLLENVDITVILQIPRINMYIYQMRYHISKDLNCSITNINIKATTTDTLGYIGRSEGISCVAVTLLTR